MKDLENIFHIMYPLNLKGSLFYMKQDTKIIYYKLTLLLDMFKANVLIIQEENQNILHFMLQ